MNEIFNKSLLVVDMLLSELHLWQTGFTYRFCDSFTKHPERIQKLKETGDLNNIYIYIYIYIYVYIYLERERDRERERERER